MGRVQGNYSVSELRIGVGGEPVVSEWSENVPTDGRKTVREERTIMASVV